MSHADLAARIETVARHFYGRPHQALSRAGRELRFGDHGSLAVDLRRGRWYDRERREGGGLLDLIVHAGAARDRREAREWLRRIER